MTPRPSIERLDAATIQFAARVAGELRFDALVARLRVALAAARALKLAALSVIDSERELRRVAVFSPAADAKTGPPPEWAIDADPLRAAMFDGASGELDLPARVDEFLLPRVQSARVTRLYAAPLRIGERVVGVLYAGYSEQRELSSEVRHFVARLARIASPVLWNCFMQARFDRGDRRRDALMDLTRVINTSLELGAVLDSARDALCRLEAHPRSSIDLLGDDRAAFTPYPIDRAPDSPPPPARAVEGGYLAEILATRATLRSADLSLSAAFPGDAAFLAAGVRRYVAAPLLARGHVLGALFIASDDPHPPLKTDVWLYENVALQLALAIDNARKHEQVTRLSQRLQDQNIYLREEIQSQHNFGETIGRSPPMQRVFHDIQRVAATAATVLITGETGVGKELVARAIHDSGPAARQPMVKVNCAAIPEGMVESELFGHERGAFTSAIERRIGRFELAHGGTLFLDEVGELPLAVQPKLLRVLQDGEFERVGGSRTLKCDVRTIAATNRNLLRAVESGAFRRDLFYRLNVFPIDVPPLAERRDDIPALVETFVAQYSRRMGKQITSIDRDSMERLRARDWPGNVRELRHVIERAMILADGPVLRVADAPPPYLAPIPIAIAPAASRATLNDVEADHIRRVLEHTRGRIEGPKGAAVLLGLKPSTLRFRIKKLGIHV